MKGPLPFVLVVVALLGCSRTQHAVTCPHELGNKPRLRAPENIAANGSRLPMSAFVIVGRDVGIGCSGTIVHLTEDTAYVLTARHCVALEDGKLVEAPTHFRVYPIVNDENGATVRAIAVRRVFSTRGEHIHTHPFEDIDWAVLEIPSDPTMRAVPLGRGDFRDGEPLTLVTARGGPGDHWVCPHADSFRWGEASHAYIIGGHSGAAIIRDGKVEAILSGDHERGLWIFNRITDVRVVRAASIGRVWE